MKVFGLTGGMGMGKSTAAALLQARGVAVVDTDDLARQIVMPGQPALAEIGESFGAGLVGEDGQLRRGELARLVFTDEVARKRLEAITHPRIRELWREQVAAWRNEGRNLAVVIIPLLFETQAEAEFDAVICIACTTATQWRRLRERGWSDTEIANRLAAQCPVEEKMARSQHVIWTEGGLEVHRQQLDRVLAGN
ncbi:MAG: dephospho-CoA kinase [Verrucomicrobiae bacterium]|nr:dephospho-CoA kinase [Verrucomicrobiae bacterium]